MRELSGAWMRHSGDFWGGFAAMLVALPASVAFGVTVYAAIDPHYAAFGALAGVLGAMALGLIAPTFGGTDRLISAPCAPAAAVLSAFAIELVHQGVSPTSIVLMLTVLGILTGVLQILIGFLGVGRLSRQSLRLAQGGRLFSRGFFDVGGAGFVRSQRGRVDGLRRHKCGAQHKPLKCQHDAAHRHVR